MKLLSIISMHYFRAPWSKQDLTVQSTGDSAGAHNPCLKSFWAMAPLL